MTDGFKSDKPDIDWLLAELEEFQQELREARNERVRSSSQFHFFCRGRQDEDPRTIN